MIETPKSLKVLKIVAVVVLVLSLLGLTSVSLLMKVPILFAGYVVSIAFYISLIVAIQTKKRVFFITTRYLLIALMVTSVLSLLLPGKVYTILKILIEIGIFKYLSKHRAYFSA